MLRLLTRLPTTTFSKELLTGVPAFDDYLRRLDAELLGRASLRRVTLEEVRDHLLDQHTMLMEQGLTSEAAAQQALEGFGSVDKLGAEQRREKTREFFKNFVLSGFAIAVLLAVLEVVSGYYNIEPWLTLVIRFAINFTTFGFVISFCMTFSSYQVGATKAYSNESVDTANVIQVYTPPKYKLLALTMLLFGGGMLIVCILGIFTLYGFYGNILIVYLALLTITFMASSCTQITLDGDQLYIKSPFRSRQFRIVKIREFQHQGLWRIFFPPAFGRTHLLTLETDQGKTHTLYLSLTEEMHNSDRLIARLEGMKDSAYLKEKPRNYLKLYWPLVMILSLAYILLLVFSDYSAIRKTAYAGVDSVFAETYANRTAKNLPRTMYNGMILTNIAADYNVINLDFMIAKSDESVPVETHSHINEYNMLLRRLFCSNDDDGKNVYEAYGVLIKGKLFDNDGAMLISSEFDYKTCSDSQM